MKKITLELEDKELQMLQDITNHISEEKIENAKADSDTIRALILLFYLNEIVPIKHGENAVVTIKEND